MHDWMSVSDVTAVIFNGQYFYPSVLHLASGNILWNCFSLCFYFTSCSPTSI